MKIRKKITLWISGAALLSTIVFSSIIFGELAEYTSLFIPNEKSRHLIEKHIPRSELWIKQDSKNEDLEEELIELGIDIGGSLCLCTLGIFILSYTLAGRILRPISEIINQSREINEKSLDKRIPLAKSRDELYELSVALNRMFDKIQHSFNRQKEFIGNASHELKSPITFLMLAQEDMLMSENLLPSAEDSLVKQLETSRRMSHLVKNLLDLSRLEQQDILYTDQVDLAALVERVLDDYADVMAEKQICIQNQMNAPCPVIGDPEKLFRLFVNLIDNAIRYNLPAEGIIQIRVERSKTEIRIEILNSGFEIPEQDISRLFEQFYRVEKSRSQALGGAGLGLAIAQKIVNLHNGRINISNGPDQMIQTTVWLPGNS